MLEWASLRNRPDVREANGLTSSGGASETKSPKKTGISLALGGGCARGWAHIGVLRALDEAGIEVSMIAGTSIGALVGGCYIAGKLDELEEFARSLTKRRIFGLLDLNLRGSGLFGGMQRCRPDLVERMALRDGKRRHDKLPVTSPVAGIITTPRLREKVGQYVHVRVQPRTE